MALAQDKGTGMARPGSCDILSTPHVDDEASIAKWLESKNGARVVSLLAVLLLHGSFSGFLQAPSIAVCHLCGKVDSKSFTRFETAILLFRFIFLSLRSAFVSLLVTRREWHVKSRPRPSAAGEEERR